jgi:hypothetical protein
MCPHSSVECNVMQFIVIVWAVVGGVCAHAAVVAGGREGEGGGGGGITHASRIILYGLQAIPQT